MARRIWLVAKRTVLAALVVLAVGIGSALAYRAFRHRQIAQMTVIDPDKGIDEALYARIGGIDQWISILGHNRDNPVVLMVHGGPGIATSPYPRTFLFNWTRDFTVVRWDQRGAGKTFGRSGAVSASVTIDRMAQDGIEVAEFIRAKLHKPKNIRRRPFVGFIARRTNGASTARFVLRLRRDRPVREPGKIQNSRARAAARGSPHTKRSSRDQ